MRIGIGGVDRRGPGPETRGVTREERRGERLAISASSFLCSHGFVVNSEPYLLIEMLHGSLLRRVRARGDDVRAAGQNAPERRVVQRRDSERRLERVETR